MVYGAHTVPEPVGFSYHAWSIAVSQVLALLVNKKPVVIDATAAATVITATVIITASLFLINSVFICPSNKMILP
jgi:hypothetical protein